MANRNKPADAPSAPPPEKPTSSSKLSFYTLCRNTVELGATMTRARGHKEFADYIDSEVARIDGACRGEETLPSYLMALYDLLGLELVIRDYCEQHPELAVILPHLSKHPPKRHLA